MSSCLETIRGGKRHALPSRTGRRILLLAARPTPFDGFQNVKDLVEYLNICEDPSNPLTANEWAERLSDAQMDNLLKVLQTRTTVPRRHTVPNSQRRAKQKELLRHLAVRGMLKDFPNHWASDNKSDSIRIFDEASSAFGTMSDFYELWPEDGEMWKLDDEQRRV